MPSPTRIRLLHLAVLASILPLTPSAFAADWLSADGSSWSDPNSWLDSALPTGNSPALIGDQPSATADATLNFDYSYSVGDISFVIDATALTGNAILSQINPNTTMGGNTEIIGDTTTRNFYNQSAGANNANTIYIANQTQSAGTYNFSGDNLSTTNLFVGNAGNGTLHQSGGSAYITTNLTLGNTAGSLGTYILDSSASASTLTTFTEYLGNNGNASFIQNGGNHSNFYNLYLAYAGNSHATYTLNAGCLTTGTEYIGNNNGAASFIQNGGIHNPSFLYLGQTGTSTNSYSLNNGNLTVTNNLTLSGNSSFSQSGGNLSSSVTTIHANSSFTQTGGNSGFSQLVFSPGASFTFTGGNLSVGQFIPPTNTDLTINSLVPGPTGPTLTFVGSPTFPSSFANNFNIGTAGLTGSLAFHSGGNFTPAAGNLYVGSGTLSLLPNVLATSIGSLYLQSATKFLLPANIYIGTAGGNGTATLIANSTLSAANTLYLGIDAASLNATLYPSSGNLSLTSSILNTATAIIGGNHATGLLSISGTSNTLATWTNTATLYLGQDASANLGNGTITATNSSTIKTNSLIISPTGNFSSTGCLTASSIQNAGRFSIVSPTMVTTSNLSLTAGTFAANTLSVFPGTFLQSGGNSSFGTLRTDAASAFSFTAGNLTVTTQLFVPNTDLFLTSAPLATSTPTLTLNGSLANFSKNIYIAYAGGAGNYIGSGTLSQFGATTGSIYVGYGRASSNNLDLGPSIGSFSLSNAAHSTLTNFYLGAAGGAGTANISATLNAANLFVGVGNVSLNNTLYPSTGNLTVPASSGGNITDTIAVIGGDGGLGSLSFSGSQWHNTTALYIGQDANGSPGIGSVTIGPAAFVSAPNITLGPTGNFSLGTGALIATNITSAGNFSTTSNITITNLTLTNGSFTTPNLVLFGAFNQSGGNATLPSANFLGATAFSLSGGTLNLTTAGSLPSLDVYVNSLPLALSGPTLKFTNYNAATVRKNIYIGDHGGLGTLAISASAGNLSNISVGSFRSTLANTDQGPGVGSLSLANASSFSFSSLSIGTSGGTGTASLAGNSFLHSSGNFTYVGCGTTLTNAITYPGNGSLAINSGAILATGTVIVGGNGGIGSISISGSNSGLQCTSLYIGTDDLASPGTGTFTAGANSPLSTSLIISQITISSTGSFNSSNTLQANFITNSGNFTQSGTLTWNKTAPTFINHAGNALFNSTASTLTTPLSLLISGGNVTFNTSQNFQSVNLTGGTTQIHALTVASSLNVVKTTAALDLTSAKLIVEDSSSDRAVHIANLKAAALPANTQNNTLGIYSSTAAAFNLTSGKNNQVVALVDNAIRLATFPSGSTNFGAINNVDANSILLTATFLGDANLDGFVDIQDLTSIANHWQQPVTDWSQGDFDNSNFVDISDLTAIANNWQSGTGSAGNSAESFSETLASLPAFGTTTATPEPASLALLALPLLLLRHRLKKNI